MRVCTCTLEGLHDRIKFIRLDDKKPLDINKLLELLFEPKSIWQYFEFQKLGQNVPTNYDFLIRRT